MTMPLMKPKRKNPVLRTQQMNLPPWSRSRVALGWVTMGQVLSLPMIIAGVILFVLAHRRGAEVPNAAVP